MSRIALAAIKIFSAEIHPDWRTSAWGSWSTIVALRGEMISKKNPPQDKKNPYT
jgi:hypothetical protein